MIILRDVRDILLRYWEHKQKGEELRIVDSVSQVTAIPSAPPDLYQPGVVPMEHFQTATARTNSFGFTVIQE